MKGTTRFEYDRDVIDNDYSGKYFRTDKYLLIGTFTVSIGASVDKIWRSNVD